VADLETRPSVAGRVARNGAALFTARVAGALAGTLALPVLYSRLGRQEFGVWVLLAGLVALMGYVDMGLGSAQTREVARAVSLGETRTARAVLAIGVGWGACLSALALAGFLLCWPAVASLFRLGPLAAEAHDAVLVLLLGFTVVCVAGPWRAVLEGLQRYSTVAALDGGAAVLNAALSAMAVLAGGGLVALAVVTSLTNTARSVAIVGLAHRTAPSLRPSPADLCRQHVVAALHYCVPIQVTNVAAAASNETDRLVLGGFVGPAAVAGYEPGNKLANLLRMPAALITTAMFPAAATAAATADPARLNRLYLGMTRYLATYAALGAAFLVACADPLVRLWLGHRVPLAATTLALMAPAYAVNVCTCAAQMVTRAEGRPGRETRFALVTAGLNLVLTLPLLALLGPWGVPLSSALALAGGGAYFFVHFHRDSGRPLRLLAPALTWPAVVGVAAGLAGWLTTPYLPGGPGRVGAATTLLCQGLLTVLVGIALLTAVGFFDATDRERLRAIVAVRRTPALVGPPMERSPR